MIMSLQRFADIPVGTRFKTDNKEYVKIQDERLSCCKVLNAALISDSTKKTFIVPITEVEVVTE